MTDDEKREALRLIEEWRKKAMVTLVRRHLPGVEDPEYLLVNRPDGREVHLVDPERDERKEAEEWGHLTNKLVRIADNNSVDATPLRRIRLRLFLPLMTPLFRTGSVVDAIEDGLIATSHLEEKLSKGLQMPKSGPVRLAIYAEHHGVGSEAMRTRVTDHNKVHETPDLIETAGDSGVYDVDDLNRWGMHFPTGKFRNRTAEFRYGDCKACEPHKDGGGRADR